MLISSSPPPSPYDVNFLTLGIPVRVSPWFWVAAAFLGWNYARGSELGPLLVLALWIGCMLVSIVLHEMGHALAFRHYGIASHIVLYHFGGLAIPDGYGWSGSRRPHSRWRQVVISAAGPGAQLLLAAAIYAILASGGWQAPYYPSWLPTWGQPALIEQREAIANPYLATCIYFLLEINIRWACFNLLPIYPLDGGQIVRELCVQLNTRNGLVQSLALSVVVAGGMAVWNAYLDSQFGVIMFASLAMGNMQELQSLTGNYGRGRW